MFWTWFKHNILYLVNIWSDRYEYLPCVYLLLDQHLHFVNLYDEVHDESNELDGGGRDVEGEVEELGGHRGYAKRNGFSIIIIFYLLAISHYLCHANGQLRWGIIELNIEMPNLIQTIILYGYAFRRKDAYRGLHLIDQHLILIGKLFLFDLIVGVFELVLLEVEVL